MFFLLLLLLCVVVALVVSSADDFLNEWMTRSEKQLLRRNFHSFSAADRNIRYFKMAQPFKMSILFYASPCPSSHDSSGKNLNKNLNERTIKKQVNWWESTDGVVDSWWRFFTSISAFNWRLQGCFVQKKKKKSFPIRLENKLHT